MISIVNYIQVKLLYFLCFFRASIKERSKPHSGKYKIKACKSCFLCKSLDFWSSCRKCSQCCSISKCGGTSKWLLANMGLPGCQLKSSVYSEKRVQPSLQRQTPSNQNPTSQKRTCKTPQEQPPAGSFAFPFGQKGHRNYQGSILSGLLQSPLISSQTE